MDCKVNLSNTSFGRAMVDLFKPLKNLLNMYICICRFTYIPRNVDVHAQAEAVARHRDRQKNPEKNTILRRIK